MSELQSATPCAAAPAHALRESSSGLGGGESALLQLAVCQQETAELLQSMLRRTLGRSPSSRLRTVVVSPKGDDGDDECGSVFRPCRTIQRGLLAQLVEREAYGDAGAPSITLLEGVFLGAGNTELTLHGVEVEIKM